MIRGGLVALACLLTACAERAPEGPQRDPEPPIAEPAPTPAPEEAAAPPPASPPSPPSEPAPSGDARCTRRGEPLRVTSEAGPPAIVADGDAFVVASYSVFGGVVDRVSVARVPVAGPTRPLPPIALDPPLPRLRASAPALSSAGGRVLVGAIDGRSRVLLASIGAAGAAAFVPIADGADPRFPPAITSTPLADLVAYTKGATPMRLIVLRRPRGEGAATRHDVTPTAMGGAAPTFVVGADPPVLLFVDARIATSPLLEVVFDAESRPTEARVLRPLANLFEPADVVAVTHGGHTWIGYTAVGTGASTAVGLVRSGGDAPAPVAIVPGFGYGLLGVDAALGPSGPLFVADAPLGHGAHSPREVRLRALDAGALAPAEQVVGPEGNAMHAAVASTPEGEVGVAYTTRSGVYVQRLHCR